MTAREPAILGLDLGTTEVKAGLVTLDGRLLALARSGYALDDVRRPRLGRAGSRARGGRRSSARSGPCAPPTSPRSWRSASTDTARRSWRSTRAARRRGRRSRSSTRGRPRRRTSSDGATGVQGWSLGGLPAALWVERHEPAVAAATCWYLSTWEWLAFRLTGVADAPLVPNQVMADPAVVAAAGVPADRLPPRSAMGSVVGGLTGTAADALGLRARDPGRRAGPSTRSRATSEPAFSNPATPTTRAVRRAASGSTGIEPVRFRAGSSRRRRWPAGSASGRRWPPRAGRSTGTATTSSAGRSRPRRSSAEAAATPPGADGLVFLPYLAGERSPIWDPEARGVLAGLTLGHGRGHIARAIVEASALAIRHVAAPMLAAGVEVTEMRVCGGPARSRVLERRQGRRDRLPGRSSPRSSRPPSSVRRSWRRSGSAPSRTCRPRSAR